MSEPPPSPQLLHLEEALLISGSISSRPFSKHIGYVHVSLVKGVDQSLGILEVLFGKQDPHVKSQWGAGWEGLVWLTSAPTHIGPLKKLCPGRGRQDSGPCMILFTAVATHPGSALTSLPPAG